MIVIDKVCYRRKNEQILDMVSMTIPDGGLFTLVGPFGAGKSTLMKIITGVIKPDSGNVYINNINCLTDIESARQLFGYVPENIGTYDSLTVKEYLVLFAQLNEMEEDEYYFLIENLLQFAGLSLEENDYLQELTKAQKVRLSIVRALLHNPAILILDDAMAGLELDEIRMIQDMLQFLIKTNRTILLTSDNLSLSASISTSIMIIDEGKILEQERLVKVFEKLKQMQINQAKGVVADDIKEAQSDI